MRIALATCSELPGLDREGQILAAAIEARGVEVTPAIWNQHNVDWDLFDLVVIRSTWDYQYHLRSFVSWGSSIGSRLQNSIELVSWNASKRYLEELQAWGFDTVPSLFIGPNDDVALPDYGGFVVKPAVSAGSKDTARYDQERKHEALMHAQQLQSKGREILVQPYRDSVDTVGEIALVFLNGRFSHAMTKAALLRLDETFELGLFRKEDMSLAVPRAIDLEIGTRLLSDISERIAVPLYARVDLVRNVDGKPEVLELELIEPSLFLDYAPNAEHRLAVEILRRCQARPSR